MSFPAQNILPLLKDSIVYRMVWFEHPRGTIFCHTDDFIQTSVTSSQGYGLGEWAAKGELVSSTTLPRSHRSPGFIEWHDWPLIGRAGYNINGTQNFALIRSASLNSPGTIEGRCATTYFGGGFGILENNGRGLKEYVNYWRVDDAAWDLDVIETTSFLHVVPENWPPPPIIPKYLYLGIAAPPPPPPPDMNCCSCNDIASIIAENAIAEIKQHQATRDLIDRRTLEGLREINKMLQGMQINLDLQPVIDRLNELEANLWNGPQSGG